MIHTLISFSETADGSAFWNVMSGLKGMAFEFHLFDGSVIVGEVEDWIIDRLVVALLMDGSPIGQVKIKPDDITRIVYI